MKSQGFTLIEMMIALVIIGVLTALSLPMFETGIINSKVRGAAESLQNGLRLAQQTAANRNMPVRLMLSDAGNEEAVREEVEGNRCGDKLDSGNATNPKFWVICVLAKPNERGFNNAAEVLAVRPLRNVDDDPNSDNTITVSSLQTPLFKTRNFVEFKPLGGTNLTNERATFRFEINGNNPGVQNNAKNCADNSTNKGEVRCLQVILEPSGRSRVCDKAYDGITDANSKISPMACNS